MTPTGITREKMMSPDRRLTLYRIAWIAIVLWCEIGLFFYSTLDCRWPEPEAVAASPSVKPTHVLLVADPQILDQDSYPGRNSFLIYISQCVVDYNMRRAWRVAKTMRPDVVLFLGDMMDNGRLHSSSQYYHSYLARFWKIFSTPPSLPVYFIPGNHDVGIGDDPETSKLARLRYITSFGPLNQHISIANHSLLLIDAPKLVEQENQRFASGMNYAQQLPKEILEAKFINSITSGGIHPRTPLILFSHIPLSRPDDASCGPLREEGNIHTGRGYEYQNTLSREASAMLLENFRPSIIFSADDHDYCEYTHHLPFDDDHPISPSRVREVSTKSFSMAMGILHPGIHLLSLLNPDPLHENPAEQRTFADRPCFFPDQVRVYLSVYVPLIVVTLLLVLHHSARTPHAYSRVPHARSGSDADIELRGLPKPALLADHKPRAASAFPRRRASLCLRAGPQLHDPGLLARFVWDLWSVVWPALSVFAFIATAVFC